MREEVGSSQCREGEGRSVHNLGKRERRKKRKAGFLIFSEFHFPLLLKDGTRVPLKIIKRHP